MAKKTQKNQRRTDRSTQSIAEQVQQKIDSGTVQMRSQWSILAERLGMSGSALFLVVFLIAITAFILYWLSQQGDLFWYPGRGVLIALQSFPILFVGLFFLLFFLLSVVLLRFDFSYKYPFVGILAVLLAIILGMGLMVNLVPGPRGLFQRHLPPQELVRSENLVVGKVVQIDGDLIVVRPARRRGHGFFGVGHRKRVELHEERVITVRITESTRMRFGQPQVDDTIRVIGVYDGNEFVADGVRVFKE